MKSGRTSIRQGIAWAPARALQMMASSTAVACFMLAAGAAGAAAQTTVLLSTNAAREPANNSSYSPAIAADGRFVAFASTADDLVGDDSNGRDDVFVADLDTGEIEIVSLLSDRRQLEGDSRLASIDARGRLVTFATYDRDANGRLLRSTVYLRNRASGRTLAIGPEQPDIHRYVDAVRISADGSTIVYWGVDWTSQARSLFAHDRETRVTRTVAGDERGYRNATSLSGDGSVIAFSSTRFAETEGQEFHNDIFVYDRATDQVERISVGTDGSEANGGSSTPTISRSGRWIAYQSQASNLVEGDTNDGIDIFVYDREQRSTVRLSLGVSGIGYCDKIDISARGRFITFEGDASLVPGNDNELRSVFRYDRLRQQLEPVSISITGPPPAPGFSGGPAMTADGQCIAFFASTPLVPEDTNLWPDVYATTFSDWEADLTLDRDRVQAGATLRISVTVENVSVDDQSVAGWVDLLLPDGSTWRGIPAIGPAYRLIRSGDINKRTVRFTVPRSLAPGGPYTLALRLGDFPVVNSTATAQFTIESP